MGRQIGLRVTHEGELEFIKEVMRQKEVKILELKNYPDDSIEYGIREEIKEITNIEYFKKPATVYFDVPTYIYLFHTKLQKEIIYSKDENGIAICRFRNDNPLIEFNRPPFDRGPISSGRIYISSSNMFYKTKELNDLYNSLKRWIKKNGYEC